MVRLLHLVPRESVVFPYPSVSTGDPLGPLVAAFLSPCEPLGGSGGLEWNRRSGSTSRHARSCARNKVSTGPRMGLLQPLPIPSRPWADISLDLALGSQFPKATPRSSWWWTGFPRWPDLSPCLNCLRPKKQPKSWLTTSSGSMVSPGTSSQTVVPSSYCASGGNFAGSLESRSAWPQDITRSPMARPNAWTSSWKPASFA